MVRKWSYLTPITSPNLISDLGGMKRIHTFKVFKATTRFKKYNTGITKLVRRKNAIRKHKTNWLNFNFIIVKWVRFFIKYKQYVRFYQSLGLFSINVNSSMPFFTKQYSDLVGFNGVFIYSTTRYIFNKYKGSVNYGINFTKYTRLTYVGVSDVNLIQNSPLTSSLAFLDKNYVPLHIITDWSRFVKTKTDLSSNMYNITSNLVLLFYKIFIKLTLFKIKFFF